MPSARWWGRSASGRPGWSASPGEGRFVAHLAEGLQAFADRDAALAALEAALVAEAAARARAAGAEDLRVTVTRDIREVEVEGRAMFIEATRDRHRLGPPAGGARRASRFALDASGPPRLRPPHSWLGSSAG